MFFLIVISNLSFSSAVALNLRGMIRARREPRPTSKVIAPPSRGLFSVIRFAFQSQR